MSSFARRLLRRKDVRKLGPNALTPEAMDERLKSGSRWCVMWGGSPERGELALLIKDPRRGIDETRVKQLQPGEGVAAHCTAVIDQLIAEGYYKAEHRQQRLDEVRGALELHGWSWDGES